MMPGRLLSLIELFGYKGDRKVGLELLYRAGGWVKDEDEPRITQGKLVQLSTKSLLLGIVLI